MKNGTSATALALPIDYKVMELTLAVQTAVQQSSHSQLCYRTFSAVVKDMEPARAVEQIS